MDKIPAWVSFDKNKDKAAIAHEQFSASFPLEILPYRVPAFSQLLCNLIVSPYQYRKSFSASENIGRNFMMPFVLLCREFTGEMYLEPATCATAGSGD